VLRVRLLGTAAQQRHDGIVIVWVGACARAFHFLDPADSATGDHLGWLTNGKTRGWRGMRSRIRRVQKRTPGNGTAGDPSTGLGAYLSLLTRTG
jgi:hypothetical protein